MSDGSNDVSADDVEVLDESDLESSTLSEIHDILVTHVEVENEHYDALASQLEKGFASMGKALAKSESSSTKDASTVSAVVIDSTQWDYLSNSLRVNSTCALMSVCMVCVLSGIVLWMLFTRGWTR